MPIRPSGIPTDLLALRRRLPGFGIAAVRIRSVVSPLLSLAVS